MGGDVNRPYPPSSLIELSDFGMRVTPAPEVWEWLQSEIFADTGSIHNEDHAHLLDADIRIMWASSSFAKQGRTVLGQAEQVAFRAGGWQKDPLVVSIDAAGKLFINKDEIQPDLLEFNLQSAKAKDPDVRVQLQADDGVNYGEVARAMASIERAGITKLSVITAR